MPNSRTLRASSLLVSSALLWLSTGQPVHAQATFTGLGDLSGGGTYSIPSAISADGSTVVGISSGGVISNEEAFAWTNGGGMVPLGDLPGGVIASQARAVSADGSVVVGESSSTLSFADCGSFCREAFLWTSGGGIVGLGDLAGGPFNSNATGVSADGSTVVGIGLASITSFGDAFSWTSVGGMVPLGGFSADGSLAFDVSADAGVVVGLGYLTTGIEAARWPNGMPIDGLGFLPGGSVESAAAAVSADGEVIVGYSSTAAGFAPFRWTATTGMVDLGVAPIATPDDPVFGVSADGSVIVGSMFDGQAFIWDAVNGARDLETVLSDGGVDLTGWQLRRAIDVSDDGLVIVGLGDPPGLPIEQAWIATVPVVTTVPAFGPAAGVALIAGLVGLGMLRLRSLAS